MPKVSDAHRQARRGQILDAAVACFVRRGIRATTMAEIIAESELSAGAIYGYFDSKEELVLAAISREAVWRAAELEATAEGKALRPSQVLRSITDALARRSATSAFVVQMWGEAASDPEVAQIAASAFAELGELLGTHLRRWGQESQGLDEEAAGGWAGRMLPVVLALLQGVILQRTLMPDFDREGYLSGIDELFRSS